MTKKMEITKILLKLNPKLISSEEDVQTLVMGDSLDFESGMQAVAALKEEEENEEVAGAEGGTASTESEDGILFKGNETFNFPTPMEAVVIKTTLELANNDEKEAFNLLLDRLNTEFQSIYKKKRAEIINAVTSLADLAPQEAIDKNTSEAVRLMEVIKESDILFIKK